MPSMTTIAHAASPADLAAVEELLREYTEWAFTLDPRSDDAPTFRGLHEELRTLPGVYAPPRGRILLARHDGRPVGCVCLKPHDESLCELKRLYVRPEARGRAIGSKLVAGLLEEARSIGYRRIVLDSHASMTAAHALYDAAGFRRVAAPAGYPEEMRARVVFMERGLP
jgi:ribosomal protein S18 acetylase RimI-like enzyme